MKSKLFASQFKRTTFLLFIFNLTYNAYFSTAQSVIIYNATIHIGTGSVVQKGCLVVESGLIKSVIDLSESPFDTIGKHVVNASGMHLYPSLILLNSNVGLNEIEAIRATQDRYEVGSLNTHIRSVIAYNSDSDILPTLVHNGIGMVQIVPRGALVCGSSSVVVLNQKPWDQSAYALDEGMHINWPDAYTASAEDGGFSEQRERQIQAIYTLFKDAKQYLQSEGLVKNVRLEALRSMFAGKQTLYVRANFSREVFEVLQFVQTFQIAKVALIGARDCKNAWPFIAENNWSVVLDRIHSLPTMPDHSLETIYALPAAMTKAGIRVALSYEGEMEAMGSRNLPYVAGTASAYGLNKEDALKLVTSNAAYVLGIDHRTGTLQTGKEANFVLAKNDLLDMKTSEVQTIFYKGAVLTIPNKQRELYQKYKRP